MSETTMGSYWVIVLSDWKKSDAKVTITLKSGAELGPGKVTDTGATLGAAVLYDDGMHYAGFGSGWRRERPERRWNVGLEEIAAVTAEARS